MTNEPLWRALGWQYVVPSTQAFWKRGDDVRPLRQMPDYKNERGDEKAADAAAVALLEELRQRGYWVAVEVAASEYVDAAPYRVWVYNPEQRSIVRADTFREAVVAGAETLLGVLDA